MGDTGEVAHTVILLRHSKSDWSGDHADIDRPLTKRGRRQAAEAGQWLATHVDAIDLAVVSTAERARATWELAAPELTERPRTRNDEDLYAASARGLLDVVRGLDEEVGSPCSLAGVAGVVLVESPDYDGKGKLLVRLDGGEERIVGASRVER